MSNSIRVTNPEAEFHILRLEPPGPVKGAYQGWVNNHVKLKAYSEMAINQNTIFADADTVFLRDVSELFNPDFDIAIGRRPSSAKAKYNGGVVLFKPTAAAWAFMRQWISADYRMLYDQDFHRPWHQKYNGQNQASFGYLIESLACAINLYEYPTRIINAVEQDWPHIKRTKPFILHVRKQLLDVALSGQPIRQLPSRFRDGVEIWRTWENAK
jgi:hypothetical protein